MHATLEDLARAKGVDATYVSRILRLTLLAPEIVEAILDGRQPAELQLDDLLKGFPVEATILYVSDEAFAVWVVLSPTGAQLTNLTGRSQGEEMRDDSKPPRSGSTSANSLV